MTNDQKIGQAHAAVFDARVFLHLCEQQDTMGATRAERRVIAQDIAMARIELGKKEAELDRVVKEARQPV